eukprot:Gb_20967 [translate_table: standard]
MAQDRVLHCHSVQEWENNLKEANKQNQLVVVDFTAQWCGPCRVIGPVFNELSKKYQNVTFLKVDVDEMKDVTAEWDVQAMPTFLFIKDGKEVARIVGARKDELEKRIAALAQSSKA